MFVLANVRLAGTATPTYYAQFDLVGPVCGVDQTVSNAVDQVPITFEISVNAGSTWQMPPGTCANQQGCSGAFSWKSEYRPSLVRQWTTFVVNLGQTQYANIRFRWRRPAGTGGFAIDNVFVGACNGCGAGGRCLFNGG